MSEQEPIIHVPEDPADANICEGCESRTLFIGKRKIPLILDCAEKLFGKFAVLNRSN